MPVSYRGVNLIVLFDLFGSCPSLVLVFFAVSLQVELQFYVGASVTWEAT